MLSASFFHPISELFQEEEVRAVFLVDEEGLFLPEMEYLMQRPEQDAGSAEHDTGPIMEEMGSPPQEIPIVSRNEVEKYLASLYSKSGGSEIQVDPEILSRFTLDRFDKKEFSLVYDPASLKDLEKDPQERFQSKKLVGLLPPYGTTSQDKISRRRGGYLSPERTSSNPPGRAPVRIQIEDLTPWADKILEKIERNWIIDPARPLGIKGTVWISVTITKSGDISNIEVVKSSGEQSLDFSAKNAVTRSLPLPGFPVLYPSESIVITVKFEYDA